MKIQSIKAHAIAVPLKYVYAVATEPFTVATQIIVEVMTDDGLTGLGTIHGRAAKPVLEAVDKLSQILIGMDAHAHEAIRGSGNIYQDFNVRNADVRQSKAILATEIIKALDKKGLSVKKAQALTGIDAGDFSRVRNADFRRMSVERLMTIINRLGSRIEVAVKVKRSRAAQHAAMAR